MHFTIFFYLFLATSFLSFFVSYLAWKRKKVHGAAEISNLMIVIGIYAFLIAFEVASATIEGKIFWTKISYFGAVSVPVLYFVFIMRFTGHDNVITIKKKLFLYLLPFVTLILAFTNEKHHLIWSGFSPISPETNLMKFYHGIWFWLGYMAYDYILLIIATIALFKYIFWQKNKFRKQGLVIFIAGICPWIGGLLYVTNGNPIVGFDISPALTLLSGFLLVYAMLKVDFLDLVPIARETLVETLKDGIIALDVKNRVQDVNAAACGYLGSLNTNLLGEPLDDNNVIDRSLLNAVISLESYEQFELKSEKGTKTLRISKQMIKGEPGNRLVVISDVTEQISKEMKIRAGEERYKSMNNLFRLMVDNMSDMLWAKDLKRNYIFVNKAICDDYLKAVDTEEPIGKDEMYFMEREKKNNPDHLSEWYNMDISSESSDERIIRTGKPEHFEASGNVNGESFAIDVRKAPIFDEKGDMIGLVGSARDVSIQKQVMNEINKRDTLLNAITNATYLLVAGENVDDHIHGCLDLIGKAMDINRIYIFKIDFLSDNDVPLTHLIYEWIDGSVETQVENRNIDDPLLLTQFPGWIDRLVQGKNRIGKVSEFGTSERKILESQNIKSILVIPVFIEEKLWGLIGFDDCKTEREWSSTEEQLLATASSTIGSVYVRKKNQEELLIAKEKAEESDQLKSTFLANMSHEIRTPMNSILGFISLLQEPNLTGEEKDEYINIVKKGGERLISTIRDIIDISRIETGQISLDYQDLNINEMNTYFYNLFRLEAENKGLIFNLPTKIPQNQSFIKADRNKIYSVIGNLINNALKYTKSGYVELGCDCHPEEVVFYVKDTGIGIPEDKHQSIFDRFTQADASTTRIYEGSGLGLSISKAYVEMLGGRIWVESKLHHGSTFYFQIPLNYPQDKSIQTLPVSHEMEKPEKASLNILVVEDDPNNFEYINVILTKENHKVWHTVTGSESIELCRQNVCFDIILMDIRLPDIDGCVTTQKIRLFDNDTPIIALSAYALQDDRKRALESGCNDYLTKPVRKDKLIAVIEKYTRKK
ncbi:MAG: histidine kinase N-terminal 7TM domain-containing protein [Bacteroidales bacterium]|nr:response regulator [Bacteroidales bacterium]